jgi:hypothetical protein
LKKKKKSSSIIYDLISLSVASKLVSNTRFQAHSRQNESESTFWQELGSLVCPPSPEVLVSGVCGREGTAREGGAAGRTASSRLEATPGLLTVWGVQGGEPGIPQLWGPMAAERLSLEESSRRESLYGRGMAVACPFTPGCQVRALLCCQASCLGFL